MLHAQDLFENIMGAPPYDQKMHQTGANTGKVQGTQAVSGVLTRFVFKRRVT